ncbi:MAG TPA: DUF222 domain-containing protein [Nocardioides sp.]
MTHPIVTAASDVRSTLKAVADANPTFMSVADKATALHGLVAAEGQLAELRLRILADAGDLAAETAAKDAAGWLAHHTRTRFADARADLRLAEALDRDRPLLAAAMREGSATLAQARVIDRALSALPSGVDAATVAEAEAHLVERAEDFGPKELGRIGRRILDVVAPEIAEAAEGARLAELEAHAAQRTRLTMRRLGDGTTRISSIVPDAAATRLATYLEAHANPRRTPAASAGEPGEAGAATAHDPVARLAYPRRMGEAFVAFLETVDAGRLPIHGGNATSVVVTIPLQSLRSELATAGIIGSGLVAGDDLTGDRISAAEARRLACTAKIIPMVLGGESLPLDLGRGRRLYSPAQRTARAVRDKTCRAEGCDAPADWCEAHHLDPWEEGGLTDIDDGVLLCSHHHHRAHDTSYLVERLSSGDFRFHRRT